MNEDRVRDLMVAIVSRIQAQGEQVSKEKLLMLLYLFDIEWYRKHNERLQVLTG